MRAIHQTAFGGPEVLTPVEIDRPAPAPTEVLVRVRAAGVNPVDWKARSGLAYLDLRPPFVPGWDVAGVVEEIGVGVTRFVPGDEVLGFPNFPRPGGGYAEYTTAPSRHFARKPAAMSFAAAAGLPLAGLTAWQALVDTAHAQPGQRVLVSAAAGGVGHLAVQIAAALGAHVIGTASAAKHDFLRDLGATEVVDYTAVDVATAVGDIDVVLNTLGGTPSLALAATLKPGGLMVNVVGTPPEAAEIAQRRGARSIGLLVEPDGHGLEQLVALVEAGKLRVHIGHELPLAEVTTAHDLSAAGRTTGKIILTV